MVNFFNNFDWHDFNEKTSFGREPFLFENILPFADGFSDSNTVEEAFFNFLENKDNPSIDTKFRIYDGEKRRDDIVDKISNLNEISIKTNLPEFIKSTLNKDRFSLVINNLEQVSSKLSDDFSQFTESFFKVHGMPIGGVEQVAFCGNYSGTAFGIHEGFEHAFLCHLGPGTKEFFCWSREKYLQITNNNREPIFSDSPLFDQLMTCGTKYILEPGNVLYLPASVYHIGKQDNYSVSVALPFYTYPLSRFLSLKVLPDLLEMTLPFDKEGMSSLVHLDDFNSFEDSVKILLKKSYEDWNQIYLDKYLAFYFSEVKKNKGWEIPQSKYLSILEDFKSQI